MLGKNDRTCRIYRDPTAFKVVELAQITAAFRMMAFKSPKLNENVAANVMALPRAELNARSCINILHDLARMHCRDKAIFAHLVRPAPLPRTARAQSRGCMTSVLARPTALNFALRVCVCRILAWRPPWTIDPPCSAHVVTAHIAHFCGVRFDPRSHWQWARMCMKGILSDRSSSFLFFVASDLCEYAGAGDPARGGQHFAAHAQGGLHGARNQQKAL